MFIVLETIHIISLGKNAGNMPEPQSSSDSIVSENAHLPYMSHKLRPPRATAVPADNIAPDGKVIGAETDSLLLGLHVLA